MMVAMADFFNIIGNRNIIPAERAIPQAKAAAMRALELDATLADAHSLLARTHLSEWDWEGAESEAMRALELNPSSRGAHQSYSQYLSVVGRHDEAIAMALRAQQLDPLSAPMRSDLGRSYLYARRYDEAIEQFKLSLEMGNSFGHYRLGETYLFMGLHEQSIQEFEENFRIQGSVEAKACPQHDFQIPCPRRKPGIHWYSSLRELLLASVLP